MFSVVLSHVIKSSEHILKSFRFRWCFVLPRWLSTSGSRRNGWSCQLLRSKWLHLRQLNFKNTGTRNCVKSRDLNRVTRKIKRYQLLEDLIAFFWSSVFTAIWCKFFPANFQARHWCQWAPHWRHTIAVHCCRSWHLVSLTRVDVHAKSLSGWELSSFSLKKIRHPVSIYKLLSILTKCLTLIKASHSF